MVQHAASPGSITCVGRSTRKRDEYWTALKDLGREMEMLHNISRAGIADHCLLDIARSIISCEQSQPEDPARARTLAALAELDQLIIYLTRNNVVGKTKTAIRTGAVYRGDLPMRLSSAC